MGFFDRFRSKPERSSDIARQRLLTVLVTDRVKLTPAMMEEMKAELSAVMSRYVPNVDPSAIEVTLLAGDSVDYLKADIPLRRSHE